MDFYGTVVEEIRIPVKEICDRICAVSPASIKEEEVVAYWGKIFSGLCAQSFGSAFRLQRELEVLSLQDALQHFNIDLDARILSQTISDYRAHPTLFPESMSVLSQCRIPICLVTNIDNVEIYSAVRYDSLHFDFIVTSEDCQSYKPRPETFEKALLLLNLTAKDVLHVGDSLQSDVMGAHNMGIPALWINRRKRPAHSFTLRPEYTACDLTGLLDVLECKEK